MLTPTLRSKLRKLKRYRAYRVVDIPRRMYYLWRWNIGNVGLALKWVFLSPEDTNFTYQIQPISRDYLASVVAAATGATLEQVLALFDEAERDDDLRRSIHAATKASNYRYISRPDPEFGRRLAWYAIVRLTKPRVVVETGVDKGLGGVLLCAGLRKNTAEGHPGRYFGTDLNPEAGWLIQPPYSDVGTMLYGDSLESLNVLDEEIDMFINDSDHSVDYEAAEYRAVSAKLSDSAVIVSDNAHASGALLQFAAASGWRFLFAPEYSKGHWYPGAAVGLAFRRFPHEKPSKVASVRQIASDREAVSESREARG